MDADSPPPWDFGPVYNLLDAFKLDTALSGEHSDHSPAHRPLVSDRSHVSHEPREAASLGDFNHVFEYLGVPATNHRPRHESNGSSSTGPSRPSTPPSSIPDEAIQPDEIFNRTKEVRWTDEVDGSDLAEQYDPKPERGSKLARRRRHSTTSLPRRPTALEPSVAECTPLLVSTKDADSDPVSMPRPSKSQTSSLITFPKLNINVDPLVLQPIYCLSADEKKQKLLRKLKARFGVEPVTKLGTKHSDGIHVFVDCSNIVIGFNTTLKIQRNYKREAYMKQAPISWSSLALILERGRPAARRILVGSHAPSHKGQPPKIPEYMSEAEACGYELNILDRVLKEKDIRPVQRKRRGAGNGYATASGYSSGSDGASHRIKAVVEQGVDEILHMKLLESLVDSGNPSTIVLATGDAAEAEYSGGFLKNVERAMSKGWKVELVSWENGISHEYLSRRFLRKWRGKFEVIMLDDFSEELLALYAYPIVL